MQIVSGKTRRTLFMKVLDRWSAIAVCGRCKVRLLVEDRDIRLGDIECVSDTESIQKFYIECRSCAHQMSLDVLKVPPSEIDELLKRRVQSLCRL